MYSGTMQRKDKIWITNIHEYVTPDEIHWNEVEEFCLKYGYIAYGYQHAKGNNHSNNLTSSRTRTVLWRKDQ